MALNLFKNHNQNGKLFLFENCKDESSQFNTKSGDYGGYANNIYIGLRTDMHLTEQLLLHELTHDTDKKLQNSDLYHFVYTAALANPEASNARKKAINAPIEFDYYAHAFEYETVAYFNGQNARRESGDELLSTLSSIISLYGDAQCNQDNAVINRINNCMRYRLLDYNKFEQAYQAGKEYAQMLENDKKSENASTVEAMQKFQYAYKQIMNGQCCIVNGQDCTHQSIEMRLIRCMQKEIEAIEKLKSHPLGSKVVLDIDIMSSDYPNNEDAPLELFVAEKFSEAKKLANARIKLFSREENMLEKNIIEMNNYYDISKKYKQIIDADKNKGYPLNRETYGNYIKEKTKAAIFAENVAGHIFPNYQSSTNDRHLLEIDDFKIEKLQQNIKLLNPENPDMKISPQIISNPYLPLQKIFDRVQSNHAESIDDGDDWRTMLRRVKDSINNDRSQAGQLASIRRLQLIYRELYPQAKILPEELRFDTLTADSFKQGASGGMSVCQQRIANQTENMINKCKMCNSKTNQMTYNNR